MQSQRHCKGIAKSISNSVVYFSNYFYTRMNILGIALYQLRVMAVGITYLLRQSAGFFLNNSFTPERMIYEVVLTFESADEIRWCDHLNETSLAELLRCTTCFSEFYRMKFGISVHFRLWPFL